MTLKTNHMKRFINMDKNVKCNICSTPWYIKCGKCFTILTYFGQDHGCPDIDEGFFDDCDGSMTICDHCQQHQECICCGEYTYDTICKICCDLIMKDIEMEDILMKDIDIEDILIDGSV